VGAAQPRNKGVIFFWLIFCGFFDFWKKGLGLARQNSWKYKISKNWEFT